MEYFLGEVLSFDLKMGRFRSRNLTLGVLADQRTPHRAGQTKAPRSYR